MQFSQTLQWNRRILKLNKKYSFSCTSSEKGITYFNGLRLSKKQLLILHSNRAYTSLNNGKRYFSLLSFSCRTSDRNYGNIFQFCTSRRKTSTLGNTDNEAPLTKLQAEDLILRLTEDERKTLLSALQEYNSNQVKAEYEGQLAATRWRSKFGRPSKLPTLGDVDPTGSFCHLPEDWLKKKYAEKVPVPTGQQLMRVGIFNAVPFVGFGFLDNFVMIVAGDYIDETLGSLVTISTMAAAALGNTISDVMGIGSAWYVELAASKVGLKPPNLSPVQLDMKPARRAANLGRALGIVIGCLLGMLPLLFITKEEIKKKDKT